MIISDKGLYRILWSSRGCSVDLVIFVCVNFRECLIFRLITKLRIRELSLYFSSAIIIIIFARFLNSRQLKYREIF